jgi:hypothetical protein
MKDPLNNKVHYPEDGDGIQNPFMVYGKHRKAKKLDVTLSQRGKPLVVGADYQVSPVNLTDPGYWAFLITVALKVEKAGPIDVEIKCHKGKKCVHQHNVANLHWLPQVKERKGNPGGIQIASPQNNQTLGTTFSSGGNTTDLTGDLMGGIINSRAGTVILAPNQDPLHPNNWVITFQNVPVGTGLVLTVDQQNQQAQTRNNLTVH